MCPALPALCHRAAGGGRWRRSGNTDDVFGPASSCEYERPQILPSDLRSAFAGAWAGPARRGRQRTLNEENLQSPAFVLLAFLLALLGAFLRALAVPGADLGL